jgi:opacity protein-like surface antigen
MKAALYDEKGLGELCSVSDFRTRTRFLKGAAMRKLMVLCVVMSLSLLAFGQEKAGEVPKAEIFGGYQFVRANTGVSGVSGFNLNGWNTSASGFFSRNLGVTADFSGSYGTPSFAGVGVKTNFYSFLFGPTVRFPNSSRLTPFFHGLFGVGRISGSALGVSGSDTGFAWATGGGIDAKVSRNFCIRAAQVDFLQSRVMSATQNNFRLSTGIVLRF